MKKIAALALSLVCCSNVFADLPKQIIFFGDSLTDNGNLYKMIKQPESPPYFEGRFSNGYTWSDDLANYFLLKYNIPTTNYAVGGATAKLGFPSSLIAQMLTYNPAAKDTANTLFFILMGANDYLGGQPNVDGATTKVVNIIKSDIEFLMTFKAKNFVILNIPDLAVTPYAQTVTFKANLHDLSVANNQKLAAAVADLQKAHPDAHFAIIDVYSLVNDMIQNIAKYNQKYNKNIKNVTQACLTSNSYLHQDAATKMRNELQQTLIDQGFGLKDTTAMSSQLSSSPSIAEAYAAGKAFELGSTPCDNPDTYFFWDHVHPTAVTHDVLASIVEETLKI